MIPTDAPTITKANWDSMNMAGWRFEINIDINDDDAISTLRNLQMRCGRENVATGHSFPDDELSPAPSADTLGVYVKDADDLASTLAAGLDDQEKLAAWLSN